MIKLFNKIISSFASLPLAFSPLCMSASAEELDMLKAGFLPQMTILRPSSFDEFSLRWNIPRISGSTDGTVTVWDFVTENEGYYPFYVSENGITYPDTYLWFTEKYNVDTNDTFARLWSLDLCPVFLSSYRIDDNPSSFTYGEAVRPLPQDRIERDTINIVVEYKNDGSDPDRDFIASFLLLEVWETETSVGSDIIIMYDPDTNSYHYTSGSPFVIANVIFPLKGSGFNPVPYLEGWKYPVLHFYEEYYDPVAQAFAKGYEQGYTDGYANGIARVDGNSLSSLVSSIFTAPINALYTALDVEILGYNLGNVFRGIIAGVAIFAVVAIVVKYKVG